LAADKFSAKRPVTRFNIEGFEKYMEAISGDLEK